MILGTKLRGKDTALASAVESFLLSGHDRAERTNLWYAQYLKDYREWLGRQGLEVTIASIEPNLVNAYIAEVRLSHPHVARARASTLKRFAAWLAENEIHHEVGESVLRKVKSPKIPHDVRQPYRDSELEKIIERAATSECGERDQAIVALLLGCGLRLNECRQLRLEDVDWERRSVNVRSVTSKGQRVSRRVRLDSIAARLIDHYVKDVRQDVDGPIFLTASGRTFTYSGFYRVTYRLKKRTGIKDFMAHRCRTTWATNFRRVGAGDLFDLQEEGGWVDLTMPRHYAKSRPFEERSKVTPLAGMLQSTRPNHSPSRAA